tara:strand:+ start:365 stop:592 length:228 start_codon:yes stop_codon:yes gene_type:complete
MSKFLNSKEYNDLTKVVFNSIDYKYGTEIYKKNMDRIFDKLFTITENDLLKKEEINHPISEKQSWDIAIKKANSL